MNSSNPKFLRVLVIINGKKKLSAANQRTINSLEQESDIQLDIHRTTAPLDAINHVQLNLRDNDTLICVGGDGTCNEVMNGMILSKRENVKFAILPDGTGNDFIRTTDPSANILERILRGTGQLIDIGKVSNRNGINRYFLNIAGFGLDGKVVEIMDRQRANGFGGGISYSSAIIRAFFSFKKPNVELVAEEFEHSGKVLLVAFCNGHTYGNGLKVCPDAKLDDNRMEVCVFGDVTVWHYIKYLGRLKKGLKIDHPEVHYYQTRSVSIQSQNDLAGQLDGEYHSFEGSSAEILSQKVFLINKLN